MSKANYKNASIAFESKKKMIKTDTLINFISNRGKEFDGLDDDVIMVPGIGPVTSKILVERDIKKVRDLVEIFVKLEKKHGIDAQIEFKNLLRQMGIVTPHVKTIVSCISHKSSSVDLVYKKESKRYMKEKKKIEIVENGKRRNLVVACGILVVGLAATQL